MKKARKLALGVGVMASFVSLGALARAQQQVQPLIYLTGHGEDDD